MQTTQVSSIISKLPTTYSYVVNTIPNKTYSLKNLKDKITSKTFLSKPSLNTILQNYKKKKVQNNTDTLVLRVKSKSQDNQNSFKTKKPIKQQPKLRALQNQNENVCHFKLTIASFDISEKVQMVYEIQLDKID